MEITLPNSQADQSFRSVAGKRSNGRAVYLGDPRLALLGRSPVGVEKSALTTPCPVAAGSVFSGKVQEIVNQLLKRRGLANEKTYPNQLGPHEWWLPKLADEIPVSAGKLADWARRGWIHSRRTPAQKLWIVWANKSELKRLRKLAALSHRGVVEYPSELTTPKERR